MHHYVGVLPANDLEGCLQDVHWSLGMFGNFPTYAIGNIASSQLRDSFTKAHPDCLSQIAKGDFSSYIHRFSEHVWKHGAMYEPNQLMSRAT